MKIMKQSNATLRVFFLRMVFHLYFSFALKKSRESGEMNDKCSDKRGRCTAEISSKIFWPEGPKIFGDQKFCAGDQILKLRSQLAPRIFF